MSTTTGGMPAESGPDKPPAGAGRNAEPNGNGERRRQGVTTGIAILAAIAVGVLLYWFFFARGIVYTDDARFSGQMVDLAPEINGRLIEVAVREGTFVRKGTVVFRLPVDSAGGVERGGGVARFRPGEPCPERSHAGQGDEWQPARGDQGCRGDRPAAPKRGGDGAVELWAHPGAFQWRRSDPGRLRPGPHRP